MVWHVSLLQTRHQNDEVKDEPRPGPGFKTMSDSLPIETQPCHCRRHVIHAQLFPQLSGSTCRDRLPVDDFQTQVGFVRFRVS